MPLKSTSGKRRREWPCEHVTKDYYFGDAAHPKCWVLNELYHQERLVTRRWHNCPICGATRPTSKTK